MAAKKTKLVTLKISSEKLSGFPELTAHVQKQKPRSKPSKAPQAKLKLNLSSPEAISREQSLKPGGSLSDVQDGSNSPVTSGGNLSNLNNNGGNNANSGAGGASGNGSGSVTSNINSGSKLSSNVRVGVSGLVMNTSIVRELDKSGRRTSKWAKFYTVPGMEEDSDINDTTGKLVSKSPTNGDASGCGTQKNAVTDGTANVTIDNAASITAKANSISVSSHKKIPEIAELDKNNGVISMRDLRGFKEHELIGKENELINEAKKRGRKVVRSFNGYLMLWPNWHKTEEGNLEKKVNGTSDSKQGNQKKKDTKTTSSKNSPTKASNGLESATASVTSLEAIAEAETGASAADSGSLADAKAFIPISTAVKMEI